MGPQPRETVPGEARPATLPLQVTLIPVMHNNYIFLLSRGQEAVVVDPALADPVNRVLEERGLRLRAILQTHHHSDHIGGTPALHQRWPGCAVIAAADDIERIPFQTQGVRDGDQLSLLGEAVEVIAVPGHTRAHLAFWLPHVGHLFCGDSLFAGGCGRLFEGSADQLHRSLQKLAALPAETRVWCAHEYTEDNLRWAMSVAGGDDPAAAAIRERLQTVRQQRARGVATVPTTIGEERRTNLFLRARDADSVARLRRHKDHWRG